MINDKNMSNTINCIFNNKYFPTASADSLWTNDIQGLAHNTLGHIQIRVNKNEVKNQSIDGFKQWLSQNPIQLCYELATPLTIQLTPNQVNSLVGVNNIWADSGDTEVEYRADTKLYINKKIAEAISALS